MANSFGFAVVGDKKLKRKLKKLSGRQFIRAVKSAAGKSVTPVSRAIRSGVRLTESIPGVEGITVKEQQKLLKKTIGKRSKSYGRGATIFAVAGVRGGYKLRELGLPDNAAALVEYGTENTKPQPFVRPAEETLKTETPRVFTRELAAWITKNARKN